MQRRFFDRFLKGADNGWDAEPPVMIAVRHADGTIRRRGEDAWLLARTDWTRWHLDADTAGLVESAGPPLAVGSNAFDGHSDVAPASVSRVSAPRSRLSGGCRAVAHVRGAPAGYRLALSVAGRDFARPEGADGFRGSGPFAHDDPADRPPLAVISRVHTGGQAPSSLLLPVIR